ncbi:MAG: alpha/beta hydrolase [Candidatus Limnocylindrales bacterium]
MRHLDLRQPLVVASLIATLAGCGGAASSPPPVLTPSATATEATLVADIDVGGGRTLHLVCVGPTDSGRPTVIFEAGLTGDFRTWGEPMGGLKATDRACSYDRAGNGMSPPAPQTVTTRDQVADLHALLAAAAIPAPYVLVGHSIGGWNALIYADTYPDEVSGIVLVDVRPPGMSEKILKLLPAPVAGESDAIRQNRAELTEFEHDPTQNPEKLDIAASAAQAQAVKSLGDRPLQVLWANDTAPLWEGLEPGLATRLDAAYRATRSDVEALSTNVTVVNVDAPHEIPGEQPGAILDAVKAVLQQLAA